ncbi:hypothetical protein CYANOKiyG1_53100 [Okeania sp. KiyG1]|nr:hypothetical protein CYANOKiyG1_53100 [Okeania sp. KiyG1]
MGEGRRQPTPRPSPPNPPLTPTVEGRGRQEKRVGSEEVGAGVLDIVIFLPNYAPKICSFLSVKS